VRFEHAQGGVGQVEGDAIAGPIAGRHPRAVMDGLQIDFSFDIRVRDDLPDSSFAEVLEHEINHACWHAAALKSKAAEETVVNRLTPVMMMARRDNPEIYAWIDKAIAQKE
jgi:hypothetical protein